MRNPTIPRLILLGLLVSIAIGCGAGDSGKATEEDKKNLTNMIENGIGTGPAGSGGAPAAQTPPPASGSVSPP